MKDGLDRIGMKKQQNLHALECGPGWICNNMTAGLTADVGAFAYAHSADNC